MSNTVYFDNRFIPEEKAVLPISTHALHYGTGVFEGIRAYFNERKNCLYIFRLPEHFERMKKNAAILSIQLPASVEELCEITQQLVKQNFSPEDLYIRPLAFKKDRAIGNFNLKKVNDGFFIYTVPLGRHFQGEKGISVMTSSWERVSDKAIPPRGKITGAYANTCLAKTESATLGFDEAILVNNKGNIAEASSENIFIVKDNTVITPPVTDDILEGITRNTVIAVLKEEMQLTVVEESISRDTLGKAEEIFLTGTGAEITPVTSVDKNPVGNGSIGPVSQKIKEIYNVIVHGEYNRYDHWLTKVAK